MTKSHAPSPTHSSIASLPVPDELVSAEVLPSAVLVSPIIQVADGNTLQELLVLQGPLGRGQRVLNSNH